MKIIDGQVRLSASDVANFLECRHLTRLDLLNARGVIKPQYLSDVGLDDLVKRGEIMRRTACRVTETADLTSSRSPGTRPTRQPVRMRRQPRSPAASM